MTQEIFEQESILVSTRRGWLQASKANIAYFFKRPWVFPCVIFLAVLALGLPRAISPVIKQSYQLGLDLQEYKCLPYTLYAFASGRVDPPTDSLKPIELAHGQLVAFTAHDNIMDLPELDGKRIVKVVAGLPGDVLEVNADVAYINGVKWGDLTLLETLAKQPGHYDRREVVPEGKVLLLGTTEFSYDGRYYGFIDQAEINATAYPIF